MLPRARALEQERDSVLLPQQRALGDVEELAVDGPVRADDGEQSARRACDPERAQTATVTSSAVPLTGTTETRVFTSAGRHCASRIRVPS